MLREPTLDKLRELWLHGMAHAYVEHQNDSGTSKLDFDERFGLLVDAEWLHRHNKKTKRRLTEAKLRLSQACIEDVDTGAARGIEKGYLLRLSSCAFIDEHENVIITGMTGTGKTHLACALAQQAIRKGYRAVYRRASRMMDEMAIARADGTYGKVLARLLKIDVLILDDFGLTPMREQDRQSLLDILEDRYGVRTTIVTSQLPTKAWHDYIDAPTVADSVCDRIVHNAHRFELKGPSRRKEKAAKE